MAGTAAHGSRQLLEAVVDFGVHVPFDARGRLVTVDVDADRRAIPGHTGRAARLAALLDALLLLADVLRECGA